MNYLNIADKFKIFHPGKTVDIHGKRGDPSGFFRKEPLRLRIYQGEGSGCKADKTAANGCLPLGAGTSLGSKE